MVVTTGRRPNAGVEGTVEKSRIRRAMVITAVSCAAVASSLVIAEPAHADSVIWNCKTVYDANKGGIATGDDCTRASFSGTYTGPGYIELNGVARDMCDGFTSIPMSDGTDLWAAFGHGCV